jgi:membrane-bound serine protease (ClpP class)
MPQSLTLAYVLIAVGLLLLLAELVIFSHGVLAALGIAAIAIGVALTFSYNPTTGLVTLVCIGVGLPMLLSALFRYWPKTRMGRRMFLANPDEDATVASMPVNVELEQLRGRFGRAVSALRPAGITDFDGRRVDTITEGMMVEPGQWVRCIDVRAGKVIVRPLDAMDLETLEEMDLR